VTLCELVFDLAAIVMTYFLYFTFVLRPMKTGCYPPPSIQIQWCTNPMHQVTVETKFFAVTPGIFSSPVLNVLCVTL
jgi:hypothetical protein